MNILSPFVISTLVVITLGSAIRSKRWSRNGPEYAVAPGFGPLKLDDNSRQKMSEIFTDTAQGLTVLKDASSNIHACFITEFDPEFTLTTMEKLEIMDGQTPFKITGPTKFRELMEKAGPMITKLCSRLGIYWLNQNNGLPTLPPLKINGPPALTKAPPPFNLPNHNVVDSVKVPPPLPLSTHNQVESTKPEQSMKVPPPLGNEAGHMKVPPPLHLENNKIPPPLSLANHNKVENVKAPMSIKNPPPLHTDVHVPPPLNTGMNVPPPLNTGMNVPPPLNTGMDIPPPLPMEKDIKAPPPL